MIVFVKRKLQNKKCLNGCLLLGITLFIAIAACTPMFQKGSLNMLLRSKFEAVIEEDNVYPAVLSRGTRIEGEDLSYSAIKENMDGYLQTWQTYIDVSEKALEKHIWLDGYFIKRQYGLNTDWMDIGCIPDMENHIQMLTGESFVEAEETDGVIPCILTEKVMDQYGLLVGEQIEFTGITDTSGDPLVLQITGIFDEADITDVFWHVEADEYDRQFFISESAMEHIVTEYSIREVNYEIYLLLDYLEINSTNASDVLYYLEQYHEKDELFVENISEILKDFSNQKQFVTTIFWVLELPIFVLLLAFVYMVSGQILSMEKGEISMLGSRGFSRKKIMQIYLYQSGILAGIGMVIGLPLGYLLCKLAASTDAFLQFSLKSTGIYKPTGAMILYAIVAGVFVVAFMTIPVFFYAKDSVVGRKNKKIMERNGGFFEKYWIDVILLACSLYLLYNHNKQIDSLVSDVMAGEYLDPLIFLNVTLFLFAAGLLGLRLIRYVVRLIFHIGRKKWKPHTYASFLQIMRADGKQRFISVFLIFTVAMGIFNATVAGTINENNEQRIRYNIGADVVVSEKWKPKVYMDSNLQKSVRYYEEPAYQRYEGLSEQLVEKMTRVIRDDEVKISVSGNSLEQCNLMAVHTKEFGEVASLQEDLNDTHWYNYLNNLAKNGAGVLISRNLADEMDLKVGDSLRYTRGNPLAGEGEENETSCNGIVCGIFDAWPGYEQYQYVSDENGKTTEKQQYMIVVNYVYEVNVFGATPYEIWMELKNGATLSDVEDYLVNQNITLASIVGMQEEVDEVRNSAMIQITNGLFSLSFVISIVLCTIGFLIYWITAMKQRELLYGVYRAMGMRMKEVNKMLLYEQSFSSMLAGVFGGVAGVSASLLYTRLLAIVYLPEKHNISLRTYINAMDMSRLFLLVACMIIVCFFVIKRQIRNSDILQAIKMGED